LAKEAQGKRLQAQWVNMAIMIASRLVGGIRGKDKVNGLRKPKERDSKHHGLTWQE